jgi:dihydrofolate reductase
VRKLVYYVGISIDGYIAGPNSEIDFFPLADDILSWIVECYPETLPTHFRVQIGVDDGTPNRRFDTLIMGRGTYQPALDIEVTSPYPHLRQYIVSTTLPEIADPSLRLIREDPGKVIRELKRQEGMDIWLAGGGKLAGSLLPEIDELIVKQYPIIAGAGISVFGGRFRPTLFDLVGLHRFKSGSFVANYQRNPGNDPTGSATDKAD